MITSKTCAVCRRALGPGWLLCGDDWALVPESLAQAAIRYYGRLVRPRHGDPDQLVTDQLGLLATGASAIAFARVSRAKNQIPATSINLVTSETQ